MTIVSARAGKLTANANASGMPIGMFVKANDTTAWLWKQSVIQPDKEFPIPANDKDYGERDA